METEDTNDRDMNFSENFIIISSRKMDFLTILIKKLKSKGKAHPTPDIISVIAHVVASLDPLLFVSAEELKDGHLHFGTPLEELDRNKIGEEIEKRMNNLIK